MKFRPQMQLRYESVEQYEAAKAAAAARSQSLNAFVVGLVSAALTGFNSQVRGKKPLAAIESDGSSLAGNQSGQRSTPPRDEAETVTAPVTGPEVARTPTLPSDFHSPSLPKCPYCESELVKHKGKWGCKECNRVIEVKEK